MLKAFLMKTDYTDIHYDHEGGKADYTGARDADKELEDVSWIGFKQHFFSSVLLTDTPFKKVNIRAENLVNDEDVDTLYTKNFAATMPLQFQGGEINQTMDWYYGPNEYKTLNAYDRNLDEIVPFGWGIFGLINRYLFMPFFAFLGGFFTLRNCYYCYDNFYKTFNVLLCSISSSCRKQS